MFVYDVHSNKDKQGNICVIAFLFCFVVLVVHLFVSICTKKRQNAASAVVLSRPSLFVASLHHIASHFSHYLKWLCANPFSIPCIVRS